ncbi:MAG: hypothetical protein ACLR23_04835 [Clostridia bacterium]
MSARQIVDRIRAFTPWPSCYTYLRGQKLAIGKASLVDQRSRESLGECSSLRRRCSGFRREKVSSRWKSCSFREKR